MDYWLVSYSEFVQIFWVTIMLAHNKLSLIYAEVILLLSLKLKDSQIFFQWH